MFRFRTPFILHRYIVHRYVFREILTPFFISLFVFTGVLFLTRILKLMQLVVNRTATIGDILLLFSYVIPRFLEVTVPMSLLLAIIIAFSRLSSDSELVAIRASGFSLRSLFPPVFTFSLLVGLAALTIALWVRPWANYQLGQGLFEIAKKQASSGLMAGVFNDIGQLTIYATDIENPGTKLHNVVISDQRNPENPSVFVAKNGFVVSDDVKRTLTLQLWDGSIQQGHGEHYGVTYFDINNINLSEEELVSEGEAAKGKKSDEMSYGELRQSLAALESKPDPLSSEDIKQKARYAVELQRRFVFPFACLCIAMVAMTLGIQPHRSSKVYHSGASYVLGIAMIVLYYIFVAFVSALGEQSIAPAAVVMWLPNLLFLALGFYLFRHIESEAWLAMITAFHRIWGRLVRLVNFPQRVSR